MKVRTIVTVLIAIAVLAVAVAPSTATAVTLNKYEQQTLKLVNAERARFKLPKLTVNAKLTIAARAHSTEMGMEQYFSHKSFSGESFKTRVLDFGYTRKGYKVWKAGENIAWGSGLLGSPAAIVQQWMASPVHRAVILTKAFRNAGIGAVLCETGFGDVTDPVWFYTFDFGRRSK